MPAIVAMITTPIAQRETIVVMRSQSGNQTSSRLCGSMLASAFLRSPTSQRKNRQMKVIRKIASAADAIEPANPTRAPSAFGTASETLCAPDCTLSAALVSPTDDSSSELRSCSTSCGRSLRKLCSPSRSGLRRKSRSSVTAARAPITVTVADIPRPRGVLRSMSRTGPSKTSPRKMPTATIRSVSRIETTAQVRRKRATARSSVLNVRMICSGPLRDVRSDRGVTRRA